MISQHKKTMTHKKSVAKTSIMSSHRGTLNETGRRTISVSRSLTSLSSQTSMSILPEASEQFNSSQKNIDLYEEEYCCYALQVLRSKMVQEKEDEREKEVKECLVSLKKEFQDLLDENIILYEKSRFIETFQESYSKLNNQLSDGKKLLTFMKEINFEDTLKRISSKMEENVNRLKLINIKREEIEEAFSKNLIGFHSEIHKLLKIIENHIVNGEVFLPEIVEVSKEIRSIHTENEELKIRCTLIADQLRKENIFSDYEKYFQMAVEECRDILEKLPEKRMENNLTNESLQQGTIEWGDPTSSSTPTASTTALI